MAGRSGARSRRTRMYDCNFNMGQQYYKSALDNLDRKQSGNAPLDRLLSPRPKINVDDLFEEDLQKARHRAERAITEDAFFDSRGARIPKSSIKQSNYEDDIDEEVQASLNRIRASKKLTTMPKELDFEETINTVKRRAKLDLGEKLLDAAGDDEVGSTIRRRALKMVTTASNDYIDPKNLTKWTALDDGNSNSAASVRAKASKARLNDLESEMFERSEKQMAREKRSAQMKQFLVESEIDTSNVVNKSDKLVNY
ncbi:uncharacterized protein LOC119080188 [Bradysia coprophila]|uniref:uncharacterized protein LOC119080188 n=1 Tax=Bradysia coprophila TaxID=38358 RepID=UPI00187D7E57|nr:uncharacterized protein LOC119080188 [Bradysia coprophila]XP_037044323.1 uncharacterized protein LOC119080188 [Bradysia coprophila]